MLTLRQGTIVVKTARSAIESHLSKKSFEAPTTLGAGSKEQQGAFVSLLDQQNGGELRGCIGNPYGSKPLLDQVAISAVEAATMDPRYEPVKLHELKNRIVVEVTLLSPPEIIRAHTPLELRDRIIVGRDGLMVDGMGSRGLLLPQVALQEGFDTEEFLTQCCLKAGLPPDAWLTSMVQVSSFQGQVFAEDKPDGQVFERRLEPGNRRGSG